MVLTRSIILLFILLATGCQTSPKYETQAIVGFWCPIGAAQFMDDDGSENHPLIAEVFAEHEIPVEFQYKGIAVPWYKAGHAREVLMTDPRLSGRDIIVLLSVPAGTATRTTDGFIIPEMRESP